MSNSNEELKVGEVVENLECRVFDNNGQEHIDNAINLIKQQAEQLEAARVEIEQQKLENEIRATDFHIQSCKLDEAIAGLVFLKGAFKANDLDLKMPRTFDVILMSLEKASQKPEDKQNEHS